MRSTRECSLSLFKSTKIIVINLSNYYHLIITVWFKSMKINLRTIYSFLQFTDQRIIYFPSSSYLKVAKGNENKKKKKKKKKKERKETQAYWNRAVAQAIENSVD